VREKESCHFWVGQVPEQIVEEYFVETYDEDRDDTPVSAFARDQGVTWYDHDFLEYGWGTADTIQELVAPYSYSDQWGEELARRVAAAGLSGINFFAFINQDEIENPQSVQGVGYWLRYMGTIDYRI
jgi:Immunity protein 22